jgi:DNA invertase Pin-like site-specific DNA recombinase
MATLPKPSDHKARATGQITPAVIYAAKSTDDVRGSIETQLAECEAMSVGEGWSVADAYSDEAKSAYHGSRGDGLVKAREHAAQLATEYGEAMLVVQHTDRLARGDGRGNAQHLVEIWSWARKVGVRVRSVEDDATFENPVMAAVMGERNFEDSRRKAAATAAGRRRAAQRGEWCGPVPDGYDIERTPHGAAITRRVVMHAERREVYRLLWDMVIDGATVNHIVREFAARGYRTAPRRGRPRAFDATRVGSVIVNPFYAGLIFSKREYVGEGHWPSYVDPVDWYRLRQERHERARYRPQGVGRPPTGLLARLARCESCGGAMIQQAAGPRKDGSRKRNYVCQRHMHGAGACSVRPFDAVEVERLVLGSLDKLLEDAGAWAQALLAGREGERARLASVVEDATKEGADCERAIGQLTTRYDAALEAGDEAEVDLARRAWRERSEAAERAALRQRAAEDALAADEPEPDAELVLARILSALSGEMGAAKSDVAALNGVLRSWFDRFELGRTTEHGRVRVVPVFGYDAALEFVRRRFEQRIRRSRESGFFGPLPVEDSRTGISVATETLTAETSAQSDTQRLSHLRHNTRPGSWRGTAGGRARRSRRWRGGRSRW